MTVCDTKRKDSARARAWRLNNKERHKQQRAEYYQRNKVQITLKNHEHYLANKERIREINDKWAAKNKERVQKWRQEYYKANCQRIRAANNQRRSDHREEYKQRDKAYYIKTKDNKRREYIRRNHEEILRKAREYAKRNRAEITRKERQSRLRNPEKFREKTRRCRRQLSDGYVNSLLNEQGLRIPKQYVPQQLLELKRLQIQIHRKLKELWQNHTP